MGKRLCGFVCLVGLICVFCTVRLYAKDADTPGDADAVAQQASGAASQKSGPKETELKEIVVTGEPLITPTKQTNETVYTGTQVTKKGIEIQGNKAETSVWNAVDAVPGLNSEGVDPYGLSAEQSNVRIRGVQGAFGAISVDGVPNWGGNPIGPRDYLYDTQDFRAINVYEGGVPANLGAGVGNLAGAINLLPLWPAQNFGIVLDTSVGSHFYNREFIRLDTGVLPNTGTRASLSYSYTDADKWKGPGELGPRNNVNLMLEQPVWGDDKVQFWFNYNHITQDLFRPLTWAQTQNSAYYSHDYNSQLTGIKKQDIYYYQYNHADLTNTDMFAVIPVTINDTWRLSFKPYVNLEDSDVLGGVASQGGLVQDRLRNANMYGVVSELGADFKYVKATFGYLFEADDSSVNITNYNPLDFSYLGWANYSEQLGLGYINSPYLQLAGKLCQIDWQAGVKYFDCSSSATHGYQWKKDHLVRMEDMDLKAMDANGFFPTFGLGHKFSDQFDIYGSYGKNFLRPYAYQPLITLYNANSSAFEKAGVTLQDLFNGYGMTTSNDFDLGARYRTGWFEIVPTLFYSEYYNLLTNVYDPRVNLNYNQNVGRATGYGFQLANTIFVNNHLTFFANPTYDIRTYNKNVTYAGSTLSCKGLQVTDTPIWILKTGMTYKYGAFEITPMIRYIGDRYGDVQHKEPVSDYFLVDLMMAYTWKNVWQAKSVKLSLQLQNLFNEKYISVINASDYNLGGSPSYYVGAPFSAIMQLSMKF